MPHKILVRGPSGHRIVRRATAVKIPSNLARQKATPKDPRVAFKGLNQFYHKLLEEWHRQVLEKIQPLIQSLAGQRFDAGEVDGLTLRLWQEFSHGKLKGPISRYAKEVEGSNLRTQLVGVDPLHSAPSLAIAADRFVDQNVKLITNVADKELGELQDLFKDPSTKGLSVDEIQDLVQERFKVSDSRAQLIARDQTLKLNAQITQTRQTRAGVTRYVWTTSNDERVRPDPRVVKDPSRPGPDHRALEGTVQSWDSPPVVDTKTNRRAHPGEDYQCRCTAFPLIEGIDDEASAPEEE